MRHPTFVLIFLFTIITATPTPFPANSHLPSPLQPPSNPIAFTLSMRQQMDLEEKRTLNKPNIVTLPVF